MEGIIVNIIENAFKFALNKHEGQYRKGTMIPYITHPFAVSMILKHHGYDDEVVAAGLLHDVLEDTDTSEKELLKLFGENILTLVKSASEADRSLTWEKRKRQTIEELPFKTTNEVAVIVADKLHNIHSIKADVDLLGEAVWDRFNRGKDEQFWYYTNIVKALSNVSDQVPLVIKLDSEINNLFFAN